ncbi:hypothetical protein HYZ99_04845 [Candidatus Peregrinibacteria bacterium]|nr:hypothetical protein [Candidatus Peregrinibacteria bacterium]
MSFLSLFLGLLAAILVPDAFAGPIETGAAGTVGGLLPNPGNNFNTIVSTFVVNFRPLVFIVAVFVITLSGFRMIITEEEESFNKAKRIISASVTGVMLSYLVEPFIDAFYGDGNVFGAIGIGAVPRGNAAAGASVLSEEALGVIEWALTIVGVLAVFIIIISGLKAIANAGSEEGITQLRRTVFTVISGILLIVFRIAINDTLGLPEASGAPGAPGPGPLIGAAIQILNFILGFLLIVAIAMIIYAGFQMILNFGQEDQYTKAKGLAFRVGIGLVVIAVSLVIINLVISVG